MSPPLRVYLAGPDVFHPQAHALGARKKTLCAEHGFEGLFPLDSDLASFPVPDLSRRIFAANLAMIRSADLAILNLTPFRGPSADAGTIFELGLLFGLDTPVFAYSNVAEDFAARVRTSRPVTFDAANGLWRDDAMMSVEDFGNVDNLMIDEALKVAGRDIRRVATPADDIYTDLRGFRTCLADATAWREALYPPP